MERSEQVNEIATALAKAQAAMKGAAKDSNNPFFKSRYADLASVWDACREALTANNIGVVQSPAVGSLGEATIVTVKTRNGDDRDVVRMLTQLSVTTLLLHASGQWVSGTMTCVLPTSDPQAIGSGTTYLRRYSLAAMVGVAPEDDDGEGAMGRGNGKQEVFPVSERQTAFLRKACETAGVSVTDLSAAMSVEGLADIGAADFPKALAWIKQQGKGA